MTGLIVGVVVLLLAIQYFTHDQNVEWKQVGIWLLLSYIPFILIMFASLFLVVSGGMEKIPWWLMLIAGIAQLGMLYYFLQRDYGNNTALKIVGSYTGVMILFGWII